MIDISKVDRWELAYTLDTITSEDLTEKQIHALYDAIAIVCPAYAEALEEDIQESADWYDSTTPEERAAFVEEQKAKYAPKIPDDADGNMVPFKKGDT